MSADQFEFRLYPSFRDVNLKTVEKWLEGKRADDQCEPHLWRVHDRLYDLKEFVHRHPGGAVWIASTQGTDITEAFETHHPDISTARKILQKYEICTTTKPRNSPFTFNPDEFYSVLRSRAAPIIQKAGTGPTRSMTLISDGLAMLMALLSLSALLCSSYLLAVLAGVVMGMLAISSHNYFHQRNHWRRFYFDLAGLSSYEWRISHALSHHLYANTIQDLEISAFEPLLHFLPSTNKGILYRIAVFFYSQLVFCLIIPEQWLLLWAGVLLGKKKVLWECLLPLAHAGVLALVAWLAGQSLMHAMLLCGITYVACSWWFIFVGLAAGHHHPDIWHHGDTLEYQSNDWGIRQIEAVRDRSDVTGRLFLVATMFGDHTLHHLFPTVDHSKLPLLYPVFLETCKEFGISFRLYTIPTLLLGKYRQLVRNKPRVLSNPKLD